MKSFLESATLLLLAQALTLPVYALDHRRNALGMEFVYIPPGEFRMGTSLNDAETIAWEWVNERYHPDSYTKAKRTDPRGPLQGASRVRRGGSYHCPLYQTRPAYRAANSPDTAYSVISLRVLAEEK